MSTPDVPTGRSRRGSTAFRVAAVAEALTWGGLLVGMLLEHVLGVTDLGVWLFGRLHGAAFLVYGTLALLTWWTHRWSLRTGLLSLVAALPPFGTAVFERWARRSGRLGPATPTLGT